MGEQSWDSYVFGWKEWALVFPYWILMSVWFEGVNETDLSCHTIPVMNPAHTHTHTQNNCNEETPSRDTQTKSCNGLLPWKFQNKLKHMWHSQCFQPLRLNIRGHEHMNFISSAALRVTSPALHHYIWEKLLSNTLTFKDLHHKPPK